MRRRWLTIISILLLCSAVGFPLQASTRLSHEQMRQAHQNGEVRSLRWILDQIQPLYPGRLLDAELKHKRGRYFYKIKLLQQDGYITKLSVDANNGEVLRVKTRQLEKRKK